MLPLFITILVLVGVLSLIIKHSSDSGFRYGYRKLDYKYERRRFFLTRAEHEFYDALVKAVGNEYYIFAQVHLPNLLDHTVYKQNWRAALAHINRKSVDFVLCDKTHISPKLAIELDDKTHERTDRKERDAIVENIFKGAHIPLLRWKNTGRFDSVDIAKCINEFISNVK